MVTFAYRLLCPIADDHRSSLAHGTPPNINSSNWDVSAPSTATLISNGSSTHHVRSFESFVHLCSLTKILAEMLPLVYDLHPIEESTWKTIRRLEHRLDVWQDALPDYLRHKAPQHPSDINGASNLWFCYLSVQLLLCRLALRVRTLDPRLMDLALMYGFRRL